MTKERVLAVLRAKNPRTLDAELHVYAAAWLEYQVAQANIEEHGTIVSHPRTAAPIENPYIAIRDSRAKIMLGLGLKTGDLWGCAGAGGVG